MTLDHLSFVTHDISATCFFCKGKLGYPVLIHERMLMREGGAVNHIFFDCGGGCALAFMEWQGVSGVPNDYDNGINHGLGVPSGTFHFAFRCPSLEDLEARRHELIAAGVVLGELLDLNPYRSFFLDDPVNGLRQEYTARLRDPSPADRDPEQQQFPTSMTLFEYASRPGPGHSVGACKQRGDQHGPG